MWLGLNQTAVSSQTTHTQPNQNTHIQTENITIIPNTITINQKIPTNTQSHDTKIPEMVPPPGGTTHTISTHTHNENIIDTQNIETSMCSPTKCSPTTTHARTGGDARLCSYKVWRGNNLSCSSTQKSSWSD
eukprot:GHVR01037963.1.p1 GENE.GHVR01037963.1~~GHVR01037963.1.p1  ORF type:complete len:132 (+),score=35.97 GHVR01037963.1:492-887(+)